MLIYNSVQATWIHWHNILHSMHMLLSMANFPDRIQGCGCVVYMYIHTYVQLPLVSFWYRTWSRCRGRPERACLSEPPLRWRWNWRFHDSTASPWSPPVSSPVLGGGGGAQRRGRGNEGSERENGEESEIGRKERGREIRERAGVFHPRSLCTSLHSMYIPDTTSRLVYSTDIGGQKARQ